MSNSSEIRWKQRQENFLKTVNRLDKACLQTSYTDLEKAGLIQLFEISFELSWKVLKDKLYYEGYNSNTPREVYRKCFEIGFISMNDCEEFLDALIKRNLLTHTYNEETALEAVVLIKNKYFPVINSLCQKLEELKKNE